MKEYPGLGVSKVEFVVPIQPATCQHSLEGQDGLNIFIIFLVLELGPGPVECQAYGLQFSFISSACVFTF